MDSRGIETGAASAGAGAKGGGGGGGRTAPIPQVRVQEQKSWLFRAKKFVLSKMSYVSGGRFLMSQALSRQDRFYTFLYELWEQHKHTHTHTHTHIYI